MKYLVIRTTITTETSVYEVEAENSLYAETAVKYEAAKCQDISRELKSIVMDIP
jgi:hypothetical protein